jgi:hypothetical protein
LKRGLGLRKSLFYVKKKIGSSPVKLFIVIWARGVGI